MTSCDLKIKMVDQIYLDANILKSVRDSIGPDAVIFEHCLVNNETILTDDCRQQSDHTIRVTE